MVGCVVRPGAGAGGGEQRLVVRVCVASSWCGRERRCCLLPLAGLHRLKPAGRGHAVTKVELAQCHRTTGAGASAPDGWDQHRVVELVWGGEGEAARGCGEWLPRMRNKGEARCLFCTVVQGEPAGLGSCMSSTLRAALPSSLLQCWRGWWSKQQPTLPAWQ